MRNVEIKARCDDLEQVYAILVAHDIKRKCRMRQVDTYFSVKDGRLKLREIDGSRVELIGYRRPDVAGARTSTFAIAKVADPSAVRSVLATVLGVRVVVAKTRDLYLWDNTRVHLDAVDGLGTFVELETTVYGDEVDTAERECQQVFVDLELDERRVVGPSYADLILSSRG